MKQCVVHQSRQTDDWDEKKNRGKESWHRHILLSGIFSSLWRNRSCNITEKFDKCETVDRLKRNKRGKMMGWWCNIEQCRSSFEPDGEERKVNEWSIYPTNGIKKQERLVQIDIQKWKYGRRYKSIPGRSWIHYVYVAIEKKRIVSLICTYASVWSFNAIHFISINQWKSEFTLNKCSTLTRASGLGFGVEWLLLTDSVAVPIKLTRLVLI